MENLALWLLATVGCSLVALIYYFCVPESYNFRRTCKTIALIALLTLPVNVNGYVFTIAGNAVGEKGVYSLFSLYQKSDGSVVTFIGLLGYQEAGHAALTFVGVSGYQRAGRDALAGIGLSGYQEAGRDARTLMGLSFLQRAGELERWFGAFVPLHAPTEETE